MMRETTGLTRDADQEDRSLTKPSPLDAIRAFGVVFGPSLLVDLIMAGSIAALAKRLFTRPP